MAKQAKRQSITVRVTDTADPVAVEGREIEAMNRRHNELDRLSVATRHDPPKSMEYDDQKYELYDRVRIRRARLSLMRANSLAGAAVQLREMSLIVDLCAGSEGGIREGDKRKIDRLYYSALSVIKGQLGEDASAALGLNSEDYCDPWIRYGAAEGQRP